MNQFWLAFLRVSIATTLYGIEFMDFFHQTSLRLTWPCHLSRWVRSTSSRSLSCVLTRRSYELTWSLVVTPYMQQIIAQSLRCMQALQISGSWDQDFHYMEHGAPGARIVNFYFKVMEDEKGRRWTGARWICPMRHSILRWTGINDCQRISSHQGSRGIALLQTSFPLWPVIWFCHLLGWPVGYMV